MSPFTAGFTLGLSLIVSIGPQSTFILKQGLKREHVLMVCALCTVSDTVLICMGAAGFSALVERLPQAAEMIRYGGAVFLSIYAYHCLRSAFGRRLGGVAPGQEKLGRRRVIWVCLALTWLNPHVYLDTIAFLGSLSLHYQPEQAAFALGAIVASALRFGFIGYGAQLLAPLFNSPATWRSVDAVVGTLMATLAASLFAGLGAASWQV